jgi:4'-phosphopantetheinyl transferase EntD
VIEDLTAVLQRLAGPDVAVAVHNATAPSEPLWAKERSAMARALPARLAEFTAGRAAARSAMQVLGLPKAAIPQGPDRAPQWPPGVMGSISHTDGICLALVGRAGAVAAIGVDLELNDPLPPDLWPQVCTGPELDALHSVPDMVPALVARLIFSAKECSYKCIYPQIRTVLGFDAMHIRVKIEDSSFSATLNQTAGAFEPGMTWQGRYGQVGGLLVTVMVLR